MLERIGGEAEGLWFRDTLPEVFVQLRMNAAFCPSPAVLPRRYRKDAA
jgi:hypothetical protein